MAVRISVAIGVLFFSALGVWSLAGPGPRASAATPGGGGRFRPRAGAAAFALAAVGVALQAADGPRWASVALDWLPGLYLLAGYYLPAQLPRRPAPGLQSALEECDRRIFEAGFGRFLARAPRLLLDYLEAAYLCCYVIVPSGLAALYLGGHRQHADAFWTAVLVAALPCYALVAWFETLPPRVRFAAAADAVPRLVRKVNLAVLGRASIGVNTFPSGHAAASLAAALAVGSVMPVAGTALGFVALSIAVGSVAGRYHYSLDAVFGLLAAVAAFAISRVVT